MDDMSLSQDLFGVQPQFSSVNSNTVSDIPANNVTTIYGTAMSDSENGWVSVDIDGTVCDLQTTVAVKEEDELIISVSNNSPTVTGVVGGGDSVTNAIENLLMVNTNIILTSLDIDKWEIDIANMEQAPDFSFKVENEELILSATETPIAIEEPIPNDDDLDQPLEGIESDITNIPPVDDDADPEEDKEPDIEDVEEPAVPMEMVLNSENTFALSTKDSVELDGSYVITLITQTKGISGNIALSASYDVEEENFLTGEEDDQVAPTESLDTDDGTSTAVAPEGGIDPDGWTEEKKTEEIEDEEDQEDDSQPSTQSEEEQGDEIVDETSNDDSEEEPQEIISDGEVGDGNAPIDIGDTSGNTPEGVEPADKDDDDKIDSVIPDESSIPEIPISELEIHTVEEDIITYNIGDDEDVVVFEKQYIFTAHSSYSFLLTIGDNFKEGEVWAKVSFTLQPKKLIDASGAIAKAREDAENSKAAANSALELANSIEKNLGEVSQSVEDIEKQMGEIDSKTKPVLDAIEEIQGEKESFKEGIQDIISSTATANFATKNDLIEYAANFQSNIAQSATRIKFSVTEDDITDVSPDAEDSIEVARELYLNAQEQYSNAQQTYSVALTERALAISTLETASNNLDMVETQVNILLNHPDVTQEDKIKAQAILDEANDAYLAATLKVEEVKNLFGKAKEDLDRAEAIMQSALSKLNECQDNKIAKKAELNVLADQISSKVSQTTFDDGMNVLDEKYTQLSQTADSLKLDFVELANNQEVLKYIKFEDGSIILGSDPGTDGNAIRFYNGLQEVAHIENDNLYITRVKVTQQLEVNNWKWQQRTNGNISFRYIEGD